jgi:hypothetical protein
MSCRRPPPPPELLVEVPVLVLEELELDDPEELLVEYFVEELLELSDVSSFVPKSVQLSQTSSSAPSTLMRLGLDVSVPHISHWTILYVGNPPG